MNNAYNRRGNRILMYRRVLNKAKGGAEVRYYTSGDLECVYQGKVIGRYNIGRPLTQRDLDLWRGIKFAA